MTVGDVGVCVVYWMLVVQGYLIRENFCMHNFTRLFMPECAPTRLEFCAPSYVRSLISVLPQHFSTLPIPQLLGGRSWHSPILH